ncbi:SelT/SelW/SelH family protein [Flammeovirga kamogawensis]|uniref:SelT/SelW/SelH family protein n=1 Tax=Flammeovirga kamogawensis TaxID=373891 RepID=A0ABX8GYM6_9BACT|nr:SelT/SelW/SelH family protein [Flammeovirga kamogawensis]MBB6459150.1 selenoprotein W-related protein [Flammeovirga kamogawensis]QWG08716.1 SelT/SelW/SelH family protein [Flammeovirga kamogawensis]TRX67009.1 SelT/SelW/SelH family protein [Flammeovirga kamogawensis]
MKVKITIEYCTLCQWTPRAVWMQQELLYTFNEQIEEIALRPTNGGVFKISVDDQLVWDRKEDGFPEPKAVKQKIRNKIDPERSLGHSDK